MHDNFPLDLTPKAMSHIQSKVKSTDVSGIQICLQISGCNGYQMSLQPVTHQPVNTKQLSMENIAFYADQETIEKVRGTRVELHDLGFGQSKLVFCHPKATHVCGCGESFTLEENSDG